MINFISFLFYTLFFSFTVTSISRYAMGSFYSSRHAVFFKHGLTLALYTKKYKKNNKKVYRVLGVDVSLTDPGFLNFNLEDTGRLYVLQVATFMRTFYIISQIIIGGLLSMIQFLGTLAAALEQAFELLMGIKQNSAEVVVCVVQSCNFHLMKALQVCPVAVGQFLDPRVVLGRVHSLSSCVIRRNSRLWITCLIVLKLSSVLRLEGVGFGMVLLPVIGETSSRNTAGMSIKKDKEIELQTNKREFFYKKTKLTVFSRCLMFFNLTFNLSESRSLRGKIDKVRF